MTESEGKLSADVIHQEGGVVERVLHVVRWPSQCIDSARRWTLPPPWPNQPDQRSAINATVGYVALSCWIHGVPHVPIIFPDVLDAPQPVIDELLRLGVSNAEAVVEGARRMRFVR